MTARLLAGSRPRGLSARELLPRLGRAVLWVALAVVLVRGLSATLASRPTRLPPRVARTGVAWPDDATRAFAVLFATAYLDQPPAGAAELSASRLAAFVAPDLVDDVVPQSDGQGRRMVVRSVVPAGVTRLDARHALITVAAILGDPPARTLRLAVPVARDARGGLVVYDLPSLAPTPARAADGPPDGDPLVDAGQRSAITVVLTRFLRAYLAGDRAGLSYLVPAGTMLGATAGGFELLDVRSVTTVGPTSGPVRRVLVTVDVRDRVSRAVMALRYRVRLVKRDRWYVAGLNGRGSGKR